jgi:hypothetical protein
MTTKKKPVSLEAMMAGDEPAPAFAGEGATVITHPASAPTAAPTYRPAKPVYEKATVYMPKAALKRLKLMGIEHDKRVNEFLQEAVDMMLAKYGQPSLKEFESL